MIIGFYHIVFSKGFVFIKVMDGHGLPLLAKVVIFSTWIAFVSAGMTAFIELHPLL